MDANSDSRSFQVVLDQFRESLRECELLYAQCAHEVIEQHPQSLDRTPREFLDLMRDLCKGLVVKIYVVVMEADLRWSAAERKLAHELFRQLWNRQMTDDELRLATGQISKDSAGLSWLALIRPFVQYSCLRDRVSTSPITNELLTTLLPEDIEFEELPAAASHFEANRRLGFECPHCQATNYGSIAILGRQAQCGKCRATFTANWGEPMNDLADGRKPSGPHRDTTSDHGH